MGKLKLRKRLSRMPYPEERRLAKSRVGALYLQGPYLGRSCLSKQKLLHPAVNLLQGLIFLFLSAAVSADLADEKKFLRVASAANFYPTLKVLAKTYQNETGISMQLSSGSSGKLHAQIIQGAPYDLFFSADAERPEQLETLGLTVAHSRTRYAVGRLVLWSSDTALPKDKFPLQENNTSKTLTEALNKLLKADTFRFIALANPRHAPYGRAAKEVLETTGHWHTLQQKQQLVIGSNVIQAHQYTATGNAQLGFIALSQLISPQTPDSPLSVTQNLLESVLSKQDLLLVPEALYTPLEQQAVVLKRSDQQARALAFLDWIKHSNDARDILQARGYKVSALLPQVKPKS